MKNVIQSLKDRLQQIERELEKVKALRAALAQEKAELEQAIAVLEAT